MNGVQAAQHRSTLHPFSSALAAYEFYKLISDTWYVINMWDMI